MESHKKCFQTFLATPNYLSKDSSRKSPVKHYTFKTHQKIRVATLNARGLNKITKRESLVDIMKRFQYEILLLTETNINMNSVETWQGYTTFFSTSVDPNVKDREEKKRENDRLTGARPQNAGLNYRLAADFENAGVGIVVKNYLLNSIKNVRQVNGRVMSLTFASHGYDVTFVCAYAPHSGYPTEDKEAFFDDLTREISTCKGRYYISGDFNARIHFVRENDLDVCGPFILGRGMEYLNNMNEKTKESRALFLGFCKMHQLKILNSQFSKPAEKLLTYKEKDNDSDFGPPYDAIRYAQIDFWLTHAAWTRTCPDVQSRKDIPFDSDHVVLEAEFEMKPNLRTQDVHYTERFQKPCWDRWIKFNSDFRCLIADNPKCLQSFAVSILRAAETNLDEVPREQKRQYLSKTTWKKLQERNKLREEGASSERVRALNKEISQMARKDRKNHLIERFNENPLDPNKKGLWKAVKSLKQKFMPQFVKMRNADGRHVPVTQRAKAIADYLENTHWNNSMDVGMPQDNAILDPNGADDSPFRMEELVWSLKAAKKNKQPGPDNIQMELLKWLDDQNRQALLDLINSFWISKEAPHSLFAARVVPIYKKGDTDNAANYRPISLLSSIYKVYMVMIRRRMQNAIEDKLSSTQFGFRPGRSTSHAIYIIRRVQDFAEMKGTKLSLALLDWEKAFDKIQHDKLLLALERMGFSTRYRDVITDCYKKATFFVKDNFGSSEFKKQNAGIRQGCPLSPYLFVIVMSCIDHDIRARVSQWVLNNRIPGLTYDMVYYADDTILFSTHNRALNELLGLTEEISGKYGLRLNRGKCVTIQMNNDGNVHFQNNDSLPKKYEATYLGNEINREVNIRHEILNKIQEVRKTWFKLLPYWKASNASTKWQLIIFDAIIRSKLLYGLETVHLTTAMLKKIDAFQLRCLRRILQMAPTFINRANSNTAVLQRATTVAYPQPNDHRQVQLFSTYYKNRTASLLGHVLRSNVDDPLRQISFLPYTATRVPYGTKRCGRPRQNWLHYTKKYAYENVLNFYNYEEDDPDDSRIYNAAMNRQF